MTYQTQGAIFVVSGPSGSGKSSLCRALSNTFPPGTVHFSISTTTREPRKDESEGSHYHFVSKEQFREDIKRDYFLEWAEVHENYYGTSKQSVNDALAQKKLVVFDIDVQGHINIRKHYPDITTSVFITTSTESELRKRLQDRGTDSKDTIEKRIIHAYKEMEDIESFDFLLLNGDFETSKRLFLSIAHTALLKPTLYELGHLRTNWKEGILSPQEGFVL